MDLNADLGEGCGSDRELLELVSSASIACGAHAGDERTMRATIEAALEHGVAVGAHPGYADRDGFGRRETGATSAEIRESVAAQLDTFAAACAGAGAVFSHVKPHGALYNRAAREAAAAESIVSAIVTFDSSLIVLCMPGSELLQAAAAAGLSVAREAFLDRAYESGGTLVPRIQAGAVISDAAAAAERAERIVFSRTVGSIHGADVSIHADSLCVHGDSPDAVALLRTARSRLEECGVVIASFRRA